MTRKAFIADVVAAEEAGISGISQVARAAEDGEIDICYTPISGKSINIHVLATDVPSYPSGNTYMIYIESEHAPDVVNSVLEQVSNSSAGLKIPDLVSRIAIGLQGALADGPQRALFTMDDEDDGSEEDGDHWLQSPVHDREEPHISVSPETAARLNKRIRDDLRAVRSAGFKVGILRGMKAESPANLLSISVQVAKLGLSEEAIQAWDLQKDQHVVLLIRFSAGYKSFEAIISEAARSHEIEYRVGVCSGYKPTVAAAVAAFTAVSKTNGETSSDDPATAGLDLHDDESSADFGSLFISSSLNEFMSEQFTSLLKIRHQLGVGWDGAKLYYGDRQGRSGGGPSSFDDGLSGEYYTESVSPQQRLPTIVTADHIGETKGEILSFPLIAMQFFMRYLTRCTEFCLVCHDKTEDSFEALKPYVCSKPLCLYQYMSLGFGPSIEHEILTQPSVVDLLISFCYASARGRRLREYPTGMSLSVPLLPYFPFTDPVYIQGRIQTSQSAIQPSRAKPGKTIPVNGGSGNDSYTVKYDQVRQELLLDSNQTCPLRRGDWIALTHPDTTTTHHRVIEVLLPSVKLSGVVQRCSPTENQFAGVVKPPDQFSKVNQASIPPLHTITKATMAIYDQNFDELDENGKAEAIIMLLETSPSVKEMVAYLKQQRHVAEPSLRTWVDRLSPATLGLMRWIIASNRSCIVQVDECPSQEDSDAHMIRSRLDERVINMDGWVQFRFAQGAPDKEHRFHKALEETQHRRNSKYPTLFAWHGSRLENWHSIIRTGLNFKDTLNGRAFGHGCYHSLEFATSVGYSAMHHATGVWPASDLKISATMCLNEIVNATQEYVCHKPHLVVQHIDWIQCRYLFVKIGPPSQNDVYGFGTPTTNMATDVDPAAENRSRHIVLIEQDSENRPTGTNRKPIEIPRNAFPASREFLLKMVDSLRALSGAQERALLEETEVVSDAEDVEDLLFLLSDDDSSSPAEKDTKYKSNGNIKGKARKVDDLVILSDTEPRKRQKSLSDFVPDSLDQSTLQILQPPENASSFATNHLSRELKDILKIQDSTPLHELGWYINREMIQNVYQWIVELHSFPADIPFAKDMKIAGVKSVVLEIRFGINYPMSPPFVRVIRPRFVPFTAGGGGHITSGGAMCMELLTNSGWTAVSSLESVLVQVRMAICNLDPRPARLESLTSHKQRDYGVGEAMNAYMRACHLHGWEVPKDFREFAATGGSSLGGS